MTAPDHRVPVEELTPRQVVAELDQHVIGQRAAKRAVAIALRNRFRRQRLPPELRDDVVPRNILMIGPTGVGKTEIARRLARLVRAPFIKVEASKFTEVGYVGRDVESIARDLVEQAVMLVRAERRDGVAEQARKNAEERLLQILLPPGAPAPAGEEADPQQATRDKLRARLRAGALDEREVEIEVEEQGLPGFDMVTPQGTEHVGLDLREMLPGLFARRRRRPLKVKDALPLLAQQEAERLIDRQAVADEARRRAEQSGIVFLDEIDKICGREGSYGPEVSRQGVQRDLLPLVEGTTVTTKYGPVRTDHVLFIAAGAFSAAKPSDLIPELQGRFPIRVELEPLSQHDLERILTEPRASLCRQVQDLLGTEGLTVEFTPDAITEIALLASQLNAQLENIGARRLATLLERLLEDVSFEAPDMAGVTLRIDQAYVTRTLAGLAADRDLSRYVL